MPRKMIRRMVKSRDTAWARRAAKWLTERGVKPNWISGASVLFALAGSLAVSVAPCCGRWLEIVCFLLGIAGIQGRLLCNLFDGMVAIEGGRKTRSGELFNDFPDRLSDSFLLVGTGVAIGGMHGVALGFTCALLAMLTAYIRVLAGSAGATQRFIGPMAKQHRMALLTVLFAAAIFGTAWHVERAILLWGLWGLLAGCVITVFRRLTAAYQELECR